MAWRQRLDQLLYQGGEGHGKSGRQRSTTRLSPSTMKRRFSSSAERVPCAMGVSFTSMEHFPAPAATSGRCADSPCLESQSLIRPTHGSTIASAFQGFVPTYSAHKVAVFTAKHVTQSWNRTPAINRPSRVRHPGIFNWPEPVAVPARSIGASRGGAGRNRKSIP